MDRLIKELESLAAVPDVSSTKVMGAVIATAVRCRDVFNTRMVGLQALATAAAMQPTMDANLLHDDYLRALRAHYDSAKDIPNELRDIALAIKLVATGNA